LKSTVQNELAGGQCKVTETRPHLLRGQGTTTTCAKQLRVKKAGSCFGQLG
jgi:hypothetical protein